MKLKISFDKKAIGNFFLEHAEKVVFGIFILVFATIIYGAVMRREKFDKVPRDLSDNCNRAERVLEGERSDKLKELQARDYKNEAKKVAEFSKQGISEKPYECVSAWDKPLFESKGSRDQPEVSDVQDLRVAAEFGAFQVNPAQADEGAGGRTVITRTGRGVPAGEGGGGPSIQGKCWVVLTGLVPMEEHVNAYRKVFRDAVAYDPGRDLPEYADCYINRAEINSPADVANPKWSKQFKASEAIKEAITEWAQQQADVVEHKYVDPALTFPLGPRQDRRWEQSAGIAHEPKIPILNVDGPLTGGEGAQFGEGEDGRGNRFGGDVIIIRGRKPERGIRVQQGGEERNVVTDAELPKYKLLRFFDFSAKPGQSYIYRVQLALKNPNQGIDAGKLKDAKFAQQEFLLTAWSKQTNVVHVPNDTQILVDSVRPKSLGDFSGKVYLLKWLEKAGQEVRKDYPIERGQVLNFNNVTPTPLNPDATVDNTNFITDTTVLDMDGGKKINGKDRNLTEPGDILLMSVHGKSLVLQTRNEMDDMSEIKRVTTEPETTTVPDRTRAMPPGRGRTEGESRLLEGSENAPRRPPARRP